MALTINTNIVNNTEGGYVLDAKNVKGGYFTVDSNPNEITDFSLLPRDTKVEGSLCYCTADSKFYQYNGTSWVEKEFGITAEVTESTAGLMSANDKKKLDGIAAGAEVNVQTDWNQTSATAADYLKNKPALGSLAAKSTVSKSDLDANVQASLGKADTAIQSEEDPTVPEWAKKQTKPTLSEWAEDNTYKHVTAEEKAAWNAKSTFSGSYSDLTGVPDKFEPVDHTHEYIPIAQKGTGNGVATLDESGKILTSQLPSYVDDVLEYTNKNSFPSTGEAGKVYIDTTTNKTYRWSGSTYVVIGTDLALGETASTAYAGDKGKVAYDHSQVVSGNPHNVGKKDLGLENVENKSSATIRSELTKSDITAALGYTPPETDTIYSHPAEHPASMITGLATVATSGSYNDLTGIPTHFTPASHDHNDVYYTEKEIDTKLSGKANTEHGTHVTYSESAPEMNGTATAGTKTTVARSDHKHPTDISRAAASDLTSHTTNTNIHITSAERTNWNAHVDSDHAPTNAEKNQNAFSSIAVSGQATIEADVVTDTLTLAAGENITITTDATNDKVTIAATYTTATESANGLMSSSDKSKLDGIEAGAQVNTVTGVKGESENIYRVGDINITKANIGLSNVDNTADAEKRVSYAETAGSAASASNATNAGHAQEADHASEADYATKAANDADNNPIINTYETKVDAIDKITTHDTDTAAHKDIREAINELKSEKVSCFNIYIASSGVPMSTVIANIQEAGGSISEWNVVNFSGAVSDSVGMKMAYYGGNVYCITSINFSTMGIISSNTTDMLGYTVSAFIAGHKQILVTEHSDLATADKTIIGAINEVRREAARIPTYTSSNNGQFLRVINGEAKWSTIPNAEEVGF